MAKRDTSSGGGAMQRRHVLRMGAATAAGAVMLTGLEAGAGSPAAGAIATAARYPTLPQQDGLPAQLVRQAEITAAQFEYIYTTQTPTVMGVPLAVGIPADELPTVEWLVLTTERLVELAINFVDSLLVQFSASLDASLTPIRDRLAAVKSTVDEAAAQYRSLVSQQGTSTVASPTVLAQLGAIQSTLSTQLATVGVIRGQLITIVAADLQKSDQIGDLGSSQGLKRYSAMWATLPIPSVEQNIHDDTVFAQLRVAGANPMILTRVRGALPAKLPLTSGQFRKVMGEPLETALAAGRVYVTDYAELGSMAPADATYKLLTGTGYNSAPIAVFAVPAGGGALQAVAIQCGQDPAHSPLVLRPDPSDAANYWGWQIAKTIVQTADFNHHEMFAHLARTHLVSEAFTLATHRQLAPNHPLSVLLLPHFEGDIFINNLAALVIMSPQTFGDIILAAPIADAQAAAGRARLGWDFYANMPRSEFAARGVDDTHALPEYPYRDDALLIWDTLHAWAADYIKTYYASDADVTGDTELRAWADELTNAGKIKGFRRITSRAQLIDVVTMVMFTASAQHAAVNYPQADLMTYAPFSAGVNGAPPPTSATGHTEADWLKQLPSVFGALAQMYFLNLLGGVHYRPLGDYRSNRFPYAPAITDPRVTSGALPRFQQALKAVESTINGRNKGRTLPYPYLLPSQIPTSTNI